MLTSCLKSSKLDEPLANAANKRVGQRSEKILSPQKKSLSFASTSTASTNDSFFFRQSSLEVATKVQDNGPKLEDHAIRKFFRLSVQEDEKITCVLISPIL